LRDYQTQFNASNDIIRNFPRGTTVRCCESAWCSPWPFLLFRPRIGPGIEWRNPRVIASGPPIKHDGRAVETFVVYPESRDKTPVVLVIHEIFGLSDWVEDLADQLAAAGYIAIAPDLLSGMGPNGGRTPDFSQGGATQVLGHLDPNQVTADLNAVADYALKLPAASGKLFVTGYCWGGGQSFRFATNRSDLAAASVFYGPPPDKDALARIKAARVIHELP